MKNTVLLIVGAVAVAGIGVYFFTRKEPAEIPTTGSPTDGKTNLTPKGSNIPKSGSVAGSTAVGSTAVGGSNVNPVIDNSGNLSGSTSGQSGSGSSSQTSVDDTAEYQRKLNLANIAFEEWKLLKSSLANYVNKAGTCRRGKWYGNLQSCNLYWTVGDDNANRTAISKKIAEKLKVITDLGFKPVGDKLFLI